VYPPAAGFTGGGALAVGGVPKPREAMMPKYEIREPGAILMWLETDEDGALDVMANGDLLLMWLNANGELHLSGQTWRSLGFAIDDDGPVIFLSGKRLVRKGDWR